jgi:DNA-binding transcriptional regulator YiaG
MSTEGEEIEQAERELMAETVNPHRITVALDRAKLFGPTADAKLGAVEPDLDNWEAGKSQPTRTQLEKLSLLANVPIEFFGWPDGHEPTITVALVRMKRTCVRHVVMTGEPPGRPQPELSE